MERIEKPFAALSKRYPLYATRLGITENQMSKIGNILRSFITALRTLTILPVPGREAERPADAMCFFPLVGGIIGGFVLLAAWLFGVKLHWPAGAAATGVALLVFLTRALHLDGLSDTVDAYFGAHDIERRLQIMKDPHIGAFGAAAIALVLLIKFAALERLITGGHLYWIPIPVILSRTVMVLAAVSLPYARSDGGKARVFVEGGRPAHLIIAGLLAVLCCFLLAGWKGMVVFALAFLLGALIVRWLKKSFNGVTGDLLGFAGEKTECGLYFLLALFSGWL